jgi:hypothetical protein
MGDEPGVGGRPNLGIPEAVPLVPGAAVRTRPSTIRPGE